MKPPVAFNAPYRRLQKLRFCAPMQCVTIRNPRRPFQTLMAYMPLRFKRRVFLAVGQSVIIYKIFNLEPKFIFQLQCLIWQGLLLFRYCLQLSKAIQPLYSTEHQLLPVLRLAVSLLITCHENQKLSMLQM